MAISKAERKRNIYLAARPIFSGSESSIRERPQVAKLVLKHRTQFHQVIEGSNEQGVIDTIHGLLKDGIFDSELKAKLSFPSLFTASPERSLQHAASERCALESETDALQQVTTHEAMIQPKEKPFHATGRQEDLPTFSPRNEATTKELPPGMIEDRPSLFPIYLSYSAQHALLSRIQALLETSCYEFLATWLPHIITESGWDCPAAVELQTFLKIFRINLDSVPKEAFSFVDKETLLATLASVMRVRHAAVHRLPTNAREVQRLLGESLEMMKGLKDAERGARIESIQTHLHAYLEDVEMHKNRLENDLDSEIDAIRRQRAALDAREQDLKNIMLQEDKSIVMRISTSFVAAMQLIDDEAKQCKTRNTDEHQNNFVQDEAEV